MEASAEFVTVESVECMHGDFDVYDIQVDEDECFITSDIVAHNCELCIPLDGQEFPIDSGPRPPRHPNCRCVMSLVTKSFRELGIDADDATPEFRASATGQVPRTLTAEQWLRREPREMVVNSLGATRAKLFLDGNLPVKDFSDFTTGRIRTVAELEQRHGELFEKLGL